LDGFNGPFTCFLRAVFQNSEVLFVFVFNAVFQDAQNYQRCFFFACHLRNLYFQNFLSWNEIIHILSSTSLLTENKGALVSKFRVQRSICFLYYYNKFVSTYLEYIHSVSRTIASALVLSIGLGYVLGSRPASLLHIDIRVIYSWGSFQNSTS